MEVAHILTARSLSLPSQSPSAPPSPRGHCPVTAADTAVFANTQSTDADDGIYRDDRKANAPQIWEHLLSQCQDALRRDCSGITLHFADPASGRLPTLETDGVQIIISKGFLERLASTQDAYAEGCQLIKDLWAQLQSLHKDFAAQNVPTGISSTINAGGDVKTSLWSKTPSESACDAYTKSFMEGKTVSYYKEKGGRNVTEIKTPDGVVRFVITKRLGYRPGKDLSRLAQAHNVGRVRMISSGVQSAIRRAKSDHYLDEDEVRQAVAQMQGVVRRAKAKISALRREDILEQRARQAAKQGERKRAMEMARELKQQRTTRVSKEYAQIQQTFRCLSYHPTTASPREAALACANWPGGPISSLSMETAACSEAVPGSMALDQTI